MNISQNDYKKAIEVLDKTSKHRENIISIFQNHIDELKSKKCYLDVGIGDCVITNFVAKEFETAYVIEPIWDFCNNFKHPNSKIIHQSIHQFKTAEKFDFIMCSHMLYGMTLDEIEMVIIKLMGVLKKDGILFVALIAPRNSSHQIHLDFNKAYINSHHIRNIFEKLCIEYEKEEMFNSFESRNLDDMLSLCKFFLYEDCGKKANLIDSDAFYNKIIQSIIKNEETGMYKIVQEEDLFIIRNEGSVVKNFYK